ncbi:apolipoprotein L2 isoform X1 [Mus musculus]|uniref:apolipoprotein L2 isoform X1 n=1 Tax=Mus musculus TaxID=10090 RepID=UPI0003D70612|nr:apolipoprotein L2 isoform X1 [Mus musculus]XP_006520999.1 apolipoprotein L2 isoform X1 [Mus musculus]XP_006521000.1 apolipoprotein L2 isoform X1 [Mus musculus]XP_006521001.1 apolipoprotein L2 isoform X1 [Mus musculus]XP_006521002.1 apolipoprotein L2 isoform X1 [Mus musculus]XP_011243921.1 apolipoprotein L2 isoform X1 [Mus musculus]XP_030104413.1 apolipoprotein L2 isoform X1 [Mus musculus]|eukprot:XP_006520999.1 PREDICTED: apolipoprotein L2 isoform X4 [Mus musculus]
MDPSDCEDAPGDRTFIEEAAEYLQHTSGREDLRLLLTEDGAWEAFVAEAELSRSPTVKVFLPFSWFLFPFLQMVHPRSSPHPPCLPHPVPLFTRVAFSKASPWIHAELCFVSVLASLSEAESHRKAGPHTVLKADLDFLLPCRADADTLRDALHALTANLAVEDQERLQRDLQDMERFMDAFPQVKLELEGHIGKLRTLADKVDKVHRDCTISKLVAGSTSTVSGILTLLGLTLVPVTAGISLVLLATGMGLGAAAAVTSVSSGIVDYTSRSLAKTEASHLVSTGMAKVKMVADAVVHSGPQVLSLSENCCRVLRCIEQSIYAIKLTKANPALAASAMGSTSAQSGKHVKKAFKGTALAISRRARIMGIATAGVSLVGDVISLVKQSKNLHKGTKAKSAEELRQQARELEEKLEALIQMYEGLQAGSRR